MSGDNQMGATDCTSAAAGCGVKVGCSSQLPCAQCVEVCLPCKSSPSERAKPYAELAVASTDAFHLNSLYLAAFKREFDQGNINVDLYKQQLTIWQHQSKLAQTDLSHGLVEDLCKVLGIEITEIDAEDEDAVSVGALEEGSEGVKGNESYVQGEYLKDLRESESFKMMDDGNSLLRVVMFVDHNEVVVWNVLGEQVFLIVEDIGMFAETHKMLGMHILASLFPPEDRVVYYGMLIAPFRTTAKPHVAMAKLYRRDGSIALYILRMRRMVFPEFPNRPVFVSTFEPAPESRFVAQRHQHAPRIVQKLKHWQPSQQ